MKSFAGHRQSSHPRSGFTWIDVVVTILILLVLAALLVPATRNARTPARRSECQNNMKQLCTAVMNYASKSNGVLPWLSVANDEGIVSNWLIDLLPDLDNGGVRREWNTLTYEGRSEFEISMRMFQCQEDPTSLHVDGGLNYIANAGFGHFTIDPETNAVYETLPQGQGSADWDDDGIVRPDDFAKTIATGVFWPKRDGDTFKSSLDYISSGDGQTNTIIFAESVNAGKWNSAKTLDIAFVVGLDRIQFAKSGSDQACLKIAGADLGPYGVAGGNIPRHTPSPSSNHLGTSIYGFADGAARQISDEVDPLVYLRLMTPNGRRYGEPIEGLENY
jgi:type II secretory pathway pseudopilin PulG